MKSSPLPEAFYRRDTTSVARDLLGQMLCHRNREGQVLKGRIVETEAYLGTLDPACHTFGGRRSERTRSMYLDGGYSYVYLIYGMYHCLNVVTRTSAEPEAVLIRALEPILGVTQPEIAVKPIKSKMQTNGPGKLCRFLRLTKEHDGLPLWTTRSGLWIENADPLPLDQIVEKPRVGVDYAGEAASWPLRFYVKENPYISRR